MSKPIIGLALAIVCAIGAWQGLHDPSSPMPSPDLWSTSSARLIQDDWNMAEVSVRTDTKGVFVSWEHFPNSPSSIGRTSANVKYTASFWPTAVCADGLHLYVGGRDRAGDTIIERWTFLPPVSPQVTAQGLRREAPFRVYADDVHGRRDIRRMSVMIDFPTKLLVQFHDSREFWVLDTASNVWEKAASPSDGSVLQVPELDDDWPLFYVRKHVADGAFYTLGHPFVDETVTLRDSDLNGVLDGVMRLNTEQWHLAGYGDADSYVPRFPF